MRSVWRAARAAVRRRRLQTLLIGLVVLFATASLVVATALLDASHAPFERAFDEQRGAHLTVAFDASVADADLAATAEADGVAAAAGPFAVVTAEIDAENGDLVPGVGPGPLVVVGRDDPSGAVDRVDVWKGAWADEPGEIVLNVPPDPEAPEALFPTDLELELSDGTALTVVGYAYSLSGTAEAWVSAEQAAALGPNASQMLYRLDEAATADQVAAGSAAITAGLPPLLASQSYLVVKDAVAAGPGVYVPFLVVFGVLGIAMAVLIVANVVSGAVVSGFRHIGVLKTLGFTPRQVVAVYLVMVSVPALAGSALGTVLGAVATRPLLQDAFYGLGFGGNVEVRPWVLAAGALGMPLVVVIAALIPALRAHRLSAAAAISAGSAPQQMQAFGLQRRLAGTRLPRPVSLGIGLPAARPGRTMMTMSALLLAVTTVTFATGLVATVTAYQDAADRTDAYQVAVLPEEGAEPETDDAEMEALLRSMDETVYVTASLVAEVVVAGGSKSADTAFLRGDSSTLDYALIEGRWFTGPGEVVAPTSVLTDFGLEVGDAVAFTTASGRTEMTVVGELLAGGPGPDGFFADWAMLPSVVPDHADRDGEIQYFVRVAAGTDLDAYMDAIVAADPGRWTLENVADTAPIMGVISVAVALTVMLGGVAALGVFNTVVLNTRERRRDLGMLKSIGMTPRQVVAMTVSSMVVLGLICGIVAIPLGMATHRLVMPLVASAARVKLTDWLLDVWQAPSLIALGLAGAVIAVAGAYFPARSAARLPVAEALRSE